MKPPHFAQRAMHACGSSSKSPTLLDVMRNPLLYPLFRALIAGEISKLIVPGSYYTFEFEGDEVLVDDEKLKTVVSAIGRAIGNKRLRASPKRICGLEGQLTLRLSTAAKQALLTEMTRLLANLSETDLAALPSLQRGRGADRLLRAGGTNVPGYTIGLFEALDCADLLAVDGSEWDGKSEDVSETRRRLQLASGDKLTVDNQQVRVLAGYASFCDVEGVLHQVRFRVERLGEAAHFDDA